MCGHPLSRAIPNPTVLCSSQSLCPSFQPLESPAPKPEIWKSCLILPYSTLMLISAPKLHLCPLTWPTCLPFKMPVSAHRALLGTQSSPT